MLPLLLFHVKTGVMIQAAQAIQQGRVVGGRLNVDDGITADRALQAGGSVHSDDLPVVDHGDAVTQLFGLVHVMRGQQDGLAHAYQILDDGANGSGAHRVDANGGLIEEDQIGVVQEHPRQVQALLHPIGIGLHAIVFPPGQAHQLQQLRDAPAGILRIEAVQLGKITQVIQAAQAGIQAPAAPKGEANPMAHLARVFDQVHAEDAGLPAGGEQQCGKHFDRGGFAGAVRADEAEQLAGLDGEGYAFHSGV